MDKPVEVIFSDQAKEMYDYLLKKSAVSKEEMSILKAINRKNTAEKDLKVITQSPK